MTTALGCDRETVQTVVDRFEAACAGLAQLSFQALTGRELLAILARRETLVRQSAAVEHRLVNQLANTCTPGELGGTS